MSRECIILDVFNGFKKFYRCVRIYRFPTIMHFVEALKVRRQLYTLPNQQNKTPSIEGHRSTYLDKDIWIQEDMFIPLLIRYRSLHVNVDNGRSTTTHIIHDLLRDRLGYRLLLNCDNGFQLSVFKQFLDRFYQIAVLTMSYEYAASTLIVSNSSCKCRTPWLHDRRRNGSPLGI